MTMDWRHIGIDDLLPHRGRMRLIQDILELDDIRSRTRSVVSADWPLVEGISVDSLILIEIMAQTAGIANGWARVRKNGLDSKKTGWLVGIKQARFFMQRIPLGAEIIAMAENNFEFENFREVRCQADIDGAGAAEATLQLFQPD
ncbi:MAG: hypothetical protein ACOZF0_16365 [Thermodesulfobacteriota bacterium]